MRPADALEMYKGNTIVVTGAGGYVGSALVEALRGARCRLVLVVRRARGAVGREPVSGNCKIIEGDVGQRPTWQEALPGADYVFHLAAHEHRHGSAFNPILDAEVNALSVLHLLEVCRQEGLAPTIIFASSSHLVSFPSRVPVNETFPDDPATMFGIHKLMAEKYLQYYARGFKLQAVSLRLSNVYGPVRDPGMAGRATLNRIINAAVEGVPLTLFANQECIRDYVFIDDVVAAFLAAAAVGRKGAGQPFVIGSGVGYRIAEVVQVVADRVTLRTGQRPAIRYDGSVTLEPVAWRNFVADSSRFRDVTGWHPRVPLVEGIDRTVDYFLECHRGSRECAS